MNPALHLKNILGVETDLSEAEPLSRKKPRLLIDAPNPDETVAALRDILSDCGELYDRGRPVTLVYDQLAGGSVIKMMTAPGVCRVAHGHCRPFAFKRSSDGSIAEVDVALAPKYATMYLDWNGGWGLPILRGIASAPVLREDGTVYSAPGYDRDSGLWIENLPVLCFPEQPTTLQASAALQAIRGVFSTFCFGDAETCGEGIRVVDTTSSPGWDESAFLAALLTAVCRPSLSLTPGLLVRAAEMSGAGAGKGLLARCICAIAFGRQPSAVTAGGKVEELEKRIGAELMCGAPALFLDNVNSTELKSDLLASAITENPARVRVLGRSQMVTLSPSTFIVVTGNGLSVTEDLARRFIHVELDPRTENPENRHFEENILQLVTDRRPELLGNLLIIWRWGRQNYHRLGAGRPLGSFEKWCSWVRDPLLALGCKDPAERVSQVKDRDPRRQMLQALFRVWDEKHGDGPVTAHDLHPEVKEVLNPQGRSRQFEAARLGRLAGTRLAGYILTREEGEGDWAPATFALKPTDLQEHRDHREHRASPTQVAPDAPYEPYAEVGGPECVARSASATPPMIPMPAEADAEDQPTWRVRL